MLLLYSVSLGDMRCAICCMASLVQAEFRLKNMEDTVLSISPAWSNAAMVFSNPGSSVDVAMSVISFRACAIASSNAGS